MRDWLAERAAKTPDRVGLIFEGRVWTYAELDRLVGRLAFKLGGVGVRRGARVGVLMPNVPEAVLALGALMRLGGVMVGLNTRLTSDEMNWQLAKTGVRLVLYTAEMAEAAAGLDVNRLQVEVDHLPEATAPPGDIDLAGVQAVVFTSGTTGQPKGAEITFGNHFYSAVGSAWRLGHGVDDVWLSVLPLYHVGGMAVFFRSMLYGITPVLQRRFDVGGVGDGMAAHRVTLISLVPTMLYRLLAGGVDFPASVRLILLGGAAATSGLMDRALGAGLPVAPTYGLTEACSQVATALPAAARAKPGSVGKALMLSSVRVVGVDGETVASGEYGEVVVRGPTVMRGYYGDRGATERVLRGGELYTGDIGYMDNDGDLWLVQRRSDLIVSGGENVYPAEVEAMLLAHPGVAAVCVVGVAHPEWGQQVAAAVVREVGASVTEAGLMAFGRDRLGGYKLPRRVVFVEALPQTASGKVQRAGVRGLFEGG